MKPGDIVRLKTGAGPVMCISYEIQKLRPEERDSFRCVWFDVNWKVRHAAFYADCLVLLNL